MIGDPFPGTVSLSAVLVRRAARPISGLAGAVQAGLLAPTLYSYPANAGAYQAEGGDGTLPLRGYWLYAFQPCTLGVPAP